MNHIKVILAYSGSEGVITDTKTMHGGTFESAGWMGFVNKKRCRQRETTPERGRRWISLKTRFHCWAAQLFASGDDHWARRSARLRRDVGPRAPVHHLPRLVRVPVSNAHISTPQKGRTVRTMRSAMLLTGHSPQGNTQNSLRSNVGKQA